MWVALLNLENMYGSQESLTKVFERAVQYNEPLKVFLHLADIYTKSEKFKVGCSVRRCPRCWTLGRPGPAFCENPTSGFPMIPHLSLGPCPSLPHRGESARRDS